MEKNLKLLAARFISISSNRTEDYDGKLSINTNLKITNMESSKDENDAIKVSYTYLIDYKDLGKIEIEGYIFVGGSKDLVEKLLTDWEDKKFESPEHAGITNIIIQKASIKAFELEEELGLPVHVRLPTVTLNKEE